MSRIVGEEYHDKTYFEPVLARYYAAHASWPRVPIFVSPSGDNASHGHSLVPAVQLNVNRLRCREFVEFIGENLKILC